MRRVDTVIRSGEYAHQPEFACTVGVDEYRSPHPTQQSASQRRRRIGADMADPDDRGEVGPDEVLAVEQLDEEGFDQSQVRDPLVGDRPQDCRRRVSVLEEHLTAAEKDCVDEGLGDVGQRGTDQLPPAGRRAEVDQPTVFSMRSDTGLRDTGGPSGGDQNAFVVGRDLSGFRTGAVGSGPALGQEIRQARDPADRKHIRATRTPNRCGGTRKDDHRVRPDARQEHLQSRR